MPPGDPAGGDRVARGVLALARSLLNELDVERVLDCVLEAARQLTGARYAAIGVLDESRSGLARLVTAGIDEPTRRRIGAPPTGQGVLGELIRHPVPLRLSSVGAHPRSFGFPGGHPAMDTFLGVPVLVAGEAFGNLYLTDKRDGAQFSEDDEEAAMLLAEFAGVAIDHAGRLGGSEARRDELQRNLDALDAMVQISHAVGGETDVVAILELVAKRGRALVSARALFIELESEGLLEVVAVAGVPPAGLVGERFAREGTMADAAMRTLRTQRLDDELNRARFDEQGLGRLGIDADCGLVVPLIFRGRSFGALAVIDRSEGTEPFGEEDQRLLEAFAVSAATAVATAQVVAEQRLGERLAAAELERGRWARELHDETLQTLAALHLHLSAVRRSSDPVAIDEALAMAVEQLEHEITGVRSLITELRPPALDQLGTQAAVESLAARAAKAGVEVEVHIELADEQGHATVRHLPDQETAIYRIVQEALTNATKHGNARRVVIDVIEDATAIRITVRDDGAGFDPGDPATGYGILGMRERAELLGGSLEIDSAPGAGSTLRAAFPVHRRAGGDLRIVRPGTRRTG